MKKIIPFIVLLSLGVFSAFAQNFEISGQFRPRAEYKHGYRTLFSDTTDPATAISQRTRLNISYANQKVKTYLSLQDVRTWGDVATGNKADLNGSMIHQAWAELFLSPVFSVKAGRQTLVYDDQRIFGNSDWNQQSRSHDALLLSYKNKSKLNIQAAIVYNQNTEKDTGTFYTLTNNYKSLYSLWAHKDWEHLSLSLVFANVGMPFAKTGQAKPDQIIKYTHTVGPYITYQQGKIKGNAAFYYQTGKNNKDIDKAATYGSVDLGYNVTEKFKAGIAFQYFSGNNQVDPDKEKDHEFSTLFGTGHKFNGWMDYFYAGNSHKGVGLLDINLPLSYKKEKWTFDLRIHQFSATASIMDPEDNSKSMEKNLGTEADLGFQFQFSPDVLISGGYSQMFGTKSLAALKGGSHTVTQNWVWLMVNITPSFFRNEK
ncbi:MAG: alginate export family protein [Bacteroidales bacterium]